MPCFEFECRNCRARQERYLPHSWSPDPECETCGGATERLVSRFACPFTGPLTARYNDPKIPGAHQESFMATKIRNTPDGKPVQVYIDSFQKLREFAKSEGCADPTELPRQAEGGEKKLSSAGMPGSWY